jgi:hypothetical protein
MSEDAGATHLTDEGGVEGVRTGLRAILKEMGREQSANDMLDLFDGNGDGSESTQRRSIECSSSRRNSLVPPALCTHPPLLCRRAHRLPRL